MCQRCGQVNVGNGNVMGKVCVVWGTRVGNPMCGNQGCPSVITNCVAMYKGKCVAVYKGMCKCVCKGIHVYKGGR